MIVWPKIYGLIGYPVKHSFSAAMHNAAFKACGIEGEYRLFEVKPEDLKGFLLGKIAIKDIKDNLVHPEEIAGFNITIPHKVKAKEILMDYVMEGTFNDPDTHYILLSGAINTVRKEIGKVSLCNTDAPGFVKSLREDLDFDPADKSVFLIGCGGAGRAVVAGLTGDNTGIKKIYIYDNNETAVKSAQTHFYQFGFLKEKVEFVKKSVIPEVLKDCQLLVNASPIGMEDSDLSIIEKDLLRKDLCVYDLVYNRQTQLVKDAKDKCRAVANGIGMLLHQAAYAWEFWTGRKAPIEVMGRVLANKAKKQ